MRYDPERKVYRDCKWCHGKGCMCCEQEADKEYKRQFPSGPQPLATFDLTKPEDVAKLTAVFHRERLEHAFGSDGGGIQEITQNLADYDAQAND